jgi:hypothetical protein
MELNSNDWKYLIPQKEIPKGYEELKEFFVRKNDVFLNHPEWFVFQDKPVWEVRKEEYEKAKKEKLMIEHKQKTDSSGCEFFTNIKIKNGELYQEELIETPINSMFDYSNKITPKYFVERFGDILPSYYYDVMSAVENNEVHNYMGMTTKELKNFRKKCDKKEDKTTTNKKKKRRGKKKKPVFSKITPEKPIIVKFS